MLLRVDLLSLAEGLPECGQAEDPPYCDKRDGTGWHVTTCRYYHPIRRRTYLVMCFEGIHKDQLLDEAFEQLGKPDMKDRSRKKLIAGWEIGGKPPNLFYIEKKWPVFISTLKQFGLSKNEADVLAHCMMVAYLCRHDLSQAATGQRRLLEEISDPRRRNVICLAYTNLLALTLCDYIET